MSNPLRVHGLQHARLFCPSLYAGICPNSYPLSLSSHSLLIPSPFAFNLSQHQGIFQWVDSLHQVAKVFELQLQNQSYQWIFFFFFFGVYLPRKSSEYLEFISFRIDWFDLLAVQGTLKSLLQHHNRNINSSALSLLYVWSTSHIHIWLLEKP